MAYYSRTRDPKLKGKIGSLRGILGYMRPHWREIAYALIALCVSSIGILGLGAALRHLIDNGIARYDSRLLDLSLGVSLIVVLIVAVASFFRVAFAIKVSEAVVGAIRED